MLNNEKCPAFLPKCPAKLFGLSGYQVWQPGNPTHSAAVGHSITNHLLITNLVLNYLVLPFSMDIIPCMPTLFSHNL